ncbi:MADS-box transcription factor 18 [Dendrobium catenatum]|uniref:MADS-box transcription factor 18 n=1 Tax=Dendrobium catenatum TaxID=906689 RepID=A0A2I0W8V2_9ASPA|nr:MADS-box transcription factor 18 [Dendrobium catenatum]
MERILERYMRNSYVEKAFPIQEPVSQEDLCQEYEELKRKVDALQRSRRHVMGENLDTLSLTELQQLELQLETALKHIRINCSLIQLLSCKERQDFLSSSLGVEVLLKNLGFGPDSSSILITSPHVPNVLLELHGNAMGRHLFVDNIYLLSPGAGTYEYTGLAVGAAPGSLPTTLEKSVYGRFAGPTRTSSVDGNRLTKERRAKEFVDEGYRVGMSCGWLQAEGRLEKAPVDGRVERQANSEGILGEEKRKLRLWICGYNKPEGESVECSCEGIGADCSKTCLI